MLLRAAQPDPARFMETLTGPNRLLGLFSPPETANAGLELHEADIFPSGSESPQNSNPNPNPKNPSSSSGGRCRILNREFGILAALPDRNPNPNLISPVSISCSSSAMMIPPSARARPKQEKAARRSSAPVSIPVLHVKRGFDLDANWHWDEEEEEEEEMMPPHEIVARREGRREMLSPMMATFSVLEGAGRTLKGRDLRRVRNAVFKSTIGFED